MNTDKENAEEAGASRGEDMKDVVIKIHSVFIMEN